MAAAVTGGAVYSTAADARAGFRPPRSGVVELAITWAPSKRMITATSMLSSAPPWWRASHRSH